MQRAALILLSKSQCLVHGMNSLQDVFLFSFRNLSRRALLLIILVLSVLVAYRVSEIAHSRHVQSRPPSFTRVSNLAVRSVEAIMPIEDTDAQALTTFKAPNGESLVDTEQTSESQVIPDQITKPNQSKLSDSIPSKNGKTWILQKDTQLDNPDNLQETEIAESNNSVEVNPHPAVAVDSDGSLVQDALQTDDVDDSTEIAKAKRLALKNRMAEHTSLVVDLPVDESAVSDGIKVQGRAPVSPAQVPTLKKPILPSDVQPVGDAVLPDFTKCTNESKDCKIVSNIVLFKTHKCASTTFSSILFRFGVSHRLRILVPHYHYIDFNRALRPQIANISLYHHFTGPGALNNQEIMQWYRLKIPNSQFVTVVREPVKRALSEWYYFHQPADENVSLEDALARPKKFHLYTLANDFGIYNQTDLDEFLNGGYKRFALIAVTERFDESMMLMKYLFGWSIDDLIYLRLLDACAERHRAWDKKKVKCSKEISHDQETLNKLLDMAPFDSPIYELAQRELQKKLDVQPPQFWEDLRIYKDRLEALSESCSKPSSSGTREQKRSVDTPKSSERTKVLRRCAPYHMTDLEFERIVRFQRGLVNPQVMELEAFRLYGSDSKHKARSRPAALRDLTQLINKRQI